MKVKSSLAYCILCSVQIDDGLHLEYLSEMRQVSVLFINLLFINGEDIDDVGSLQAAFQTIYRDLRKFEG